MKRLAILGSTGSIGVTTLDLVARFPDRFEITALGAGRNVDRLAEQVRRFRPSLVAVQDSQAALALQKRIPEYRGRITYGAEGMEAVATAPGTELVVSALVGALGLLPTLRAIEAGKHVALANKEVLVLGGELVTRAATAAGVQLLPLDSEHNAIFQALRGHREEDVRRIILTASGGPFLHRSLPELRAVTREDALRHPTWKMGDKITIDSATLMNKGLEVIEAHYLFGVPYERITVAISPQSTVHSMARFADGAILAHLGVPDMRTPIGYALAYPERPPLPMVKRLDLFATQLAFHKPDTVTFRCLTLAEEAGRKAAIVACDAEAAGCAPRTVAAPIVLNAANEIAVQAFLDGRIAFLAIPEIVEKCLTWLGDEPVESLEDVYACDEEARRFAREAAGRPA
jgi:1-deoxy-D-xylulose-5-phosphate reductoisomerase